MCDYEDICPIGEGKSTDDFYTYNDREPGMYHRDSDHELSPGDIDGYDDEQDPWDYDPFGPDAGIWEDIRQAELWGHVPDSEYK